MELVYLWVDDYKNIHKQGFNFSGRYRCDYDHERNELTIDENKEYAHVFPDNINVTAIVGKNGSGKSSVLVGLTDHKILIEKDTELCSNDFTGSEIKKSLNRNEDYEIIYVDFDLVKINPIRDWWGWSGFSIHNKNLYTKTENGQIGDASFNIYKFRNNFFNLIVEHKQDFDSNLFFYNPSKIILSDYIHEVNSKDERWIRVNELIKVVHHNSLTIEKFLVFIYSNLNNQNIELPNIENLGNLNTHEGILLEHAKYMKIDDFQYLYDFFNSLNQLEDKNEISIEAFIPIYNNHKEAFLKLIEIGYLQTNFKDDIDREYDDLSQGERKLFTEHLMIYHAITKTEKEDIFVVLDEPDLTLHPDWQRKYLNETIRLLSTHENKKFHLIITSHSPFILSDLPKENIIFLEDGKQVDVKIDTFGANIHTLLSHGFFMKDGLMGEFAKEKINTAITYLNQKQLLEEEIEYCENIISIIGEPILKRQLQKMLDSKKIHYLAKDTREEIAFLKHRIDLLSKRL